MGRGSITVFLSLTTVLIMSFVTAMLEGARISCLQAEAALVSRLCTQSVFANYHRGLWEDYHLLFLDGDGKGAGFSGSGGEAEFSQSGLEGMALEEARRNLAKQEGAGAKGWNLMGLSCQDVCADAYLLATDGDGRAFLREVCRQMTLEIPYDVLEELKSQKEQSGEIMEKEANKDSQWEQALKALEKADEIQSQASGEAQTGEGAGAGNGMQGAGGQGTQGEEPQENPVEYVKQLKASSTLALVLPRGTAISAKMLPKNGALRDRSLNQGTMAISDSGGIQDLMLWYYIQQYFSCFTGPGEKGPKDRSLDYEIEYLIGGKKSDGENLEKVAKELLALREVMNFATLMGDTAKKQTALGIATALVGFTGIAPLVVAVQMGILLAWAYLESVLDVRRLLNGGRISLLKSTAEWSSDIGYCREAIEGQMEADGDEKGMSYLQYLTLLLFFHSASKLSMRCMTLLEQNEQVRMDHMVAAAKLEFTYGASPLFWNLNFIRSGGWDGFTFSGQDAFSYAGG